MQILIAAYAQMFVLLVQKNARGMLLCTTIAGCAPKPAGAVLMHVWLWHKKTAAGHSVPAAVFHDYKLSPCWLISKPKRSSSSETRRGVTMSVIFSSSHEPKNANIEAPTRATVCTINNLVS